MKKKMNDKVDPWSTARGSMLLQERPFHTLSYLLNKASDKQLLNELASRMNRRLIWNGSSLFYETVKSIQQMSKSNHKTRKKK